MGAFPTCLPLPMTSVAPPPAAALPLTWRLQRFDQLSVVALHDILQLRSEVFVVEQQCVYLDVDGKDPLSHHLSAWDGETLVACARLVPPGLSYDEASIGRVLTSPRHRASGAGRALVARSIEGCLQVFGSQPIRIGAQQYLQCFYESFGFVACSAPYVEDGILHVDMLRPV